MFGFDVAVKDWVIPRRCALVDTVFIFQISYCNERTDEFSHKFSNLGSATVPSLGNTTPWTPDMYKLSGTRIEDVTILHEEIIL